MFLQFNEIFPTVVNFSELSDDLLKNLRNTRLQMVKMTKNEETHVRVYDNVISLVEEISQIEINEINYIHRRLFHFDEEELKGYLLHALYNIMKQMHLGINEETYENDHIELFQCEMVTRYLFYELVFSIEELRDQEEYNELIRDSGLWTIVENQPCFDREYFKREILIFYDVIYNSELISNLTVPTIVNLSLNFYRSSYLARLGLYDPVYPPDETWSDYERLRHAPSFGNPAYLESDKKIDKEDAEKEDRYFFGSDPF